MKKITSILLLLCILTSVFSGFAETAQPKASDVVDRVVVTLTEGKKISLTIRTKTTQNKLGIMSYTLYTNDNTPVKSQTINFCKKGRSFGHSIDVSSYVESGKTYYAVVTFIIGNTTLDKASKNKTY